jgi:hypothetical protein
MGRDAIAILFFSFGLLVNKPVNEPAINCQQTGKRDATDSYCSRVAEGTC